jgi:hypothetical protein
MKKRNEQKTERHIYIYNLFIIAIRITGTFLFFIISLFFIRVIVKYISILKVSGKYKVGEKKIELLFCIMFVRYTLSADDY